MAGCYREYRSYYVENFLLGPLLGVNANNATEISKYGDIEFHGHSRGLTRIDITQRDSLPLEHAITQLLGKYLDF